MSVDAVALKLPTFWNTCPAAWFAQTEAQFALRDITSDDTKYYYVVSALDANTATRALSIISSPPAQNKYEKLKSFLTSAYGLSETERATTLLDLHGLGDRKPSELMDCMLALLGNHKPCFLFKHLFLRQLPENICTALANSAVEDYRALAQEADNLYNAMKMRTGLLGATSENLDNPSRTDIDLVASNADSVCWFHRRFGSNARRCAQPCKHYGNFKNKKNQGNARAGQQ